LEKSLMLFTKVDKLVKFYKNAWLLCDMQRFSEVLFCTRENGNIFLPTESLLTPFREWNFIISVDGESDVNTGLF
jgi:hypothetical protein